jgi:hypothetical protein
MLYATHAYVFFWLVRDHEPNGPKDAGYCRCKKKSNILKSRALGPTPY